MAVWEHVSTVVIMKLRSTRLFTMAIFRTRVPREGRNPCFALRATAEWDTCHRLPSYQASLCITTLITRTWYLSSIWRAISCLNRIGEVVSIASPVYEDTRDRSQTTPSYRVADAALRMISQSVNSRASHLPAVDCVVPRPHGTQWTWPCCLSVLFEILSTLESNCAPTSRAASVNVRFPEDPYTFHLVGGVQMYYSTPSATTSSPSRIHALWTGRHVMDTPWYPNRA